MPVDFKIKKDGLCNLREKEKMDSLEEKINAQIVAMAVLETRFTHTLENKHAEALATSKAIDIKFKWISIFIASLALIGTMVSIYLSQL